MIFITGASGQLGRSVAAELARRVKPSQVTLGTRHPEKIADLVAQGFQTAAADFRDPAGLEDAFRHATTVFMIPGTDPVEEVVVQHSAVIDAAVRAGIGRLVCLVGLEAGDQSLCTFAPIGVAVEEHLHRSGLNYTLLRENQRMENLDGPLMQARHTGVFALPGAKGKVAYVARGDVAAAAAGALTQHGHDHKTYDLTGPESLDAAQIAELVSKLWNRTVPAAEGDPEKVREILLTRVKLPPHAVEGVLSGYRAAEVGEYDVVTNHVATLAGRPATPLRDYLRKFA
ncbi:MAG TPA: NAD(P)H-binding protein [Steroidobacteraceae bacterium]|nr:NAD(P)H-binding protein [Steroidobacteraceae bacterium]